MPSCQESSCAQRSDTSSGFVGESRLNRISAARSWSSSRSRFAAHRDETIALLFTSDDSLNSVGIIQGTSVALFEMVAEFLRPMFVAHSDEHRPGLPIDDATEWILRSILSLLTVGGPKRRSRDGLDTYLRRFLLPPIIAKS